MSNARWLNMYLVPSVVVTLFRQNQILKHVQEIKNSHATVTLKVMRMMYMMDSVDI